MRFLADSAVAVLAFMAGGTFATVAVGFLAGASKARLADELVDAVRWRDTLADQLQQETARRYDVERELARLSRWYVDDFERTYGSGS